MKYQIFNDLQKTYNSTQKPDNPCQYSTNLNFINNLIQLINQTLSTFLESHNEDLLLQIFQITKQAENAVKILEKQGIKTFEEINKKSQQIEHLTRQNEGLLAKMKAQDIFISMIIHDMRNPVCAVISIAENVSKELEEEFYKVDKVKKMFKDSELEIEQFIQKSIEINNLNQQCLGQEIEAISNLLWNSNQEAEKLKLSNFKVSNRGSACSEEQKEEFSPSFRRVFSSDPNKIPSMKPGSSQSPSMRLGRCQSPRMRPGSSQSPSMRPGSSQISSSFSNSFIIYKNITLKSAKANYNNSLNQLNQGQNFNRISIDGFDKIVEESLEGEISQTSLSIVNDSQNESLQRSQQIDNQVEINQSLQSDQIQIKIQGLQKVNIGTPGSRQDPNVQRIPIDFSDSHFNCLRSMSERNQQQQIIQNQVQILDEDTDFNIQDEDCDEFFVQNKDQLMKPIDRMQKNFESNTNNLNKLICIGKDTLTSQQALKRIESLMQKYKRDELTGQIVENTEYNSLYELVNICDQKIIILEKQFIFTNIGHIDYPSSHITPSPNPLITKQVQQVNKNQQSIQQNAQPVNPIIDQIQLQNLNKPSPILEILKLSIQNHSQPQILQIHQINSESSPDIDKQLQLLQNQSFRPSNQNEEQIQSDQIVINPLASQQEDQIQDKYFKQLYQPNQDDQPRRQINIQNCFSQASSEQNNLKRNAQFCFQARNKFLQKEPSPKLIIQLTPSESSQSRINSPSSHMNHPIQSVSIQNDENIKNTNRSSHVSLRSVADQAKLLIKLQNNSKAQSGVALKQIQKIKENILMHLLTENKISYLKTLFSGLSFQGKMLLNLVNDLLDYAKFENGKFVFVNEPFNLPQLIKKNAFSTIQFQAQEKKIDLKYSVALELIEGPKVYKYDFSFIQQKQNENLSNNSQSNEVLIKQKEKIIEKLFLKKVIGDERRYFQIFLNFLSNALKFTQKNGTISVNFKIIQLQFLQDSNSSKSNKFPISLFDLESNSQSDKKELQILNQQEKKGSIRKIIQSIQSQSYQRSISLDLIPKADEQEGIEIDLLNLKNQSEIMLINQSNRIGKGDNNEIEEPELQGLDSNQEFLIVNAKFLIEINDNGVGIKKENLNKLFLEFGKLDEHSKMNRQGTGLGLTISRKMVRQMGGDITVESKVGQGTSFFIQFSNQILIPKKHLEKYEVHHNQFSLENQIRSQNSSLQRSDFQNPVNIQKEFDSENKNIQQPLFISRVERLSKNLIEEQSNLNPSTNQDFLQLSNRLKEIQDSCSFSQPAMDALQQMDISEKNISHSSSSQQINSQQEQNISSYSSFQFKNDKQNTENEKLQQLLKENIKQNRENLDRINLDKIDSEINELEAQLDYSEQYNGNYPSSPYLKPNRSQPSDNTLRNFLSNPSNVPSQNEINYQQSFSQNNFQSRNDYNEHLSISNSIKDQREITFGKEGNLSGSNFLNQQILDKGVNESKKVYLELQNYVLDEQYSLEQLYENDNNLISENQEEQKVNSQNSSGSFQILEEVQNSSLSQTYLKSFLGLQSEQESDKMELKCLIANDEHFQLQFKEIILKKMNFRVDKADNGLIAFNHVRKFIETYTSIREQLQSTNFNVYHFKEKELDEIKTSVKNYDFIILDLNMPIMNGYEACQHINEIYNQFNCITDFDDLLLDQEDKQLEAIKQIFGQFENDEQKVQISIQNFGKSDQSKLSISDMIKNVKQFYKFKRSFNQMCRVKPLMIACTADSSEDIKKNAKSVGFDLVITAPLTEKKVQDFILPLIRKKLEKKKQRLSPIRRELNNWSYKSELLNSFKIQHKDGDNNTFQVMSKKLFDGIPSD